MISLNAEPLLINRFLLGEGPCFNDTTGELSWVDIKTGTLNIYDFSGNLRQVQTGQYLGAAIPVKSGGYVALMTTGVYLMNESGLIKKINQPKELTIYQRFNDAKCDAAGRLWSGSMPLFPTRFRDGGSLFRFETDGSYEVVLDNPTVPNGMAWSINNKTMYFIDTATHGVDAFEYDYINGSVTNRKRIIKITDGVPDGMTIDSEGMLWIAIWGSGTVCRFCPDDGELLCKVKVPALNVTSCCFGGAQSSILYITTSCEEEQSNSLAGCVFKVDTGVTGLPTHKYDYQAIN